MKLTILGSGTGVPTVERSACSFVLETGGRKLLFDLGPGTIRRLAEAEFALSRISSVFISHFHPDHSSELVAFLFATKHPDAYRRRTPFHVVGARGIRNFYRGLVNVFGEWIELEPGLMDIVELHHEKADRFEGESFTVDSLPMTHIASSIGFRVTAADGTTLAYSGDTDECDNAVVLAREADLFICESALPDEMKVNGHLTPSLAGRIAARARVKRLLLTHFYPECESVDVEAECRKTYDGPLILARDLMKLDVKTGG
jgi:ribonuclease BN (tRNA processing enzyme)